MAHLTTAQAAEHLGITRGTLARYARDGLLRPTLTLPTASPGDPLPDGMCTNQHEQPRQHVRWPCPLWSLADAARAVRAYPVAPPLLP